MHRNTPHRFRCKRTLMVSGRTPRRRRNVLHAAAAGQKSSARRTPPPPISDRRCSSPSFVRSVFSLYGQLCNTTRPNFAKLSVHVTVARSSSATDGNAIRYVLPVLWMAFHIMKDEVYVSTSSPGGGTSRTSDNIVCRDRQVAAPGED